MPRGDEQPGKRFGDPAEVYRAIARGQTVAEEHVQKALDYLLLSAPLVEEAFLRWKRAQRAVRTTRAAALLNAPPALCRNREEREAWVDGQPSVTAAEEAAEDAEAAMRGHYARRETARTTIEAWQTASANVRANRL